MRSDWRVKHGDSNNYAKTGPVLIMRGSEGKEYVVQDGDMVYFRFNV